MSISANGLVQHSGKQNPSRLKKTVETVFDQ